MPIAQGLLSYFPCYFLPHASGQTLLSPKARLGPKNGDRHVSKAGKTPKKEGNRDHSEKRADLRSPTFPYLRAREEKVDISLKASSTLAWKGRRGQGMGVAK